MKSKIICLVLSLAFIAGMLSINGTYAWFIDYALGDGGAQSLHNLSTGNIGYTLVGSFKTMDENKRIQPEFELLAELDASTKQAAGITETTDNKMYLISTSLVDTQVRVKVFYTYIDTMGVMSDDYQFVGPGAPFVAEADENYWTYSEVDNYFYYQPSAEDAADYIPGISGETTQYLIPLFSSLRYSGESSELPTSVFKSNNKFSVKIVFQAKQADYAQWSDIGEIVFSTGETA